jgi:hypothetical protein
VVRVEEIDENVFILDIPMNDSTFVTSQNCFYDLA